VPGASGTFTKVKTLSTVLRFVSGPERNREGEHNSDSVVSDGGGRAWVRLEVLGRTFQPNRVLSVLHVVPSSSLSVTPECLRTAAFAGLLRKATKPQTANRQIGPDQPLTRQTPSLFLSLHLDLYFNPKNPEKAAPTVLYWEHVLLTRDKRGLLIADMRGDVPLELLLLRGGNSEAAESDPADTSERPDKSCGDMEPAESEPGTGSVSLRCLRPPPSSWEALERLMLSRCSKTPMISG
jgi:hypothetical protein